MQRLEVFLHWGDEEEIPVGVLATRDHTLYFEYAATFLADPLPVSPFKLPVQSGIIEHSDRDFAGVFGVFNDSLPDGWGLLLMDREFRKQGRSPASVSPLDRLAYIGMRGMGALTYHPPAAAEEGEFDIDLDTIVHQAERILEGSVEDVLPALRIAGGSPAGARPKVLAGVSDSGHLISGTVEIPEGYRHYLIKFNSREDAPVMGAIEAAYSEMARAAGLDVPASRLFATRDGGRYFGAERFDRAGNSRLHMHTLSGLLHASHRIPSMDYEGFLRATRALTRNQLQVEEAFRRMVFNVIAHNRDDHVKNFSYLMRRDGEWRLAPAYDLVFSHGPRGEHTMSVAGEARHPSEQDMLKVGASGDVGQARAREIVEQVRRAVQQWPEFARSTEVPEASIREIGNVITRAARG
jgi:serine/threonine-protein kinase HipA